MKFGVPWSVKGLKPEARETAREAARRSGMSLGEWLNSVILHQAAENGVQPSSYDDDESNELASVHHRLDELTRRIDQVMRTGPDAYAPKRIRNDNEQIAEHQARPAARPVRQQRTSIVAGADGAHTVAARTRPRGG
jgi:localization factor PodJL